MVFCRRHVLEPLRSGKAPFLRIVASLLLLACPFACDDTASDSPSDTAAECERNSDCPGTQVCSPTGRCIEQCKTEKDCAAGETCEDSICSAFDGGGIHADTGGKGKDAGSNDSGVEEDVGKDGGADAGPDTAEDGALPDVEDAGGDEGASEGEDAALADASDAGGDAGFVCATGAKRCSPDNLTVEICINNQWKNFDPCASYEAACETTDGGTRCAIHDGGPSDGGPGDTGTSDGGLSDGGLVDAGIDCTKIDYTQADQFCVDLAVPVCDLWKQCSPGDFTDGGMTIESCRQLNTEPCQQWNRVVMCCPGVTFSRDHAYECLNDALAISSCVGTDPASCADSYIYPGYSEQNCGF
ncbi:MAG: hypothetical protein HY897_18230 [Deltaproteobacteria bacterium]|nr:hypothetical protein [Deltaproteobacteria bacterium]